MNVDITPALYLIPVPMSDAAAETVLPLRVAEVVSACRHYIVENVRSARRALRRMLPAIDIDSLSFEVLDEHTQPQQVAHMLEPLRHGMPMAVMSEAGCPAVADPGALAVAEAQRCGFRVVPLVGPSSILMALMASGMNGQKWAFEGYLPREQSERRKRLQQLLRRIDTEGQTQIFIETPYRNDRLIGEMCQTLPSDLLLCVARDITGPSESIVTRTLAWWSKHPELPGKVPTIYLLYR